LLVEWTKEEKKELPPRYGCYLIYEKANDSQLKDSSLPTDAYIVTYVIDGETFTDVCKGNKIKIFDLYYDKFGPGVIQKISWGYGKINPKIWGYKAKNNTKKK